MGDLTRLESSALPAPLLPLNRALISVQSPLFPLGLGPLPEQAPTGEASPRPCRRLPEDSGRCRGTEGTDWCVLGEVGLRKSPNRG